MSKYVRCVPLKLWHSIKVQNLEKIDPKFKAKNWGCPNVWIIQSIVAHICRVYPPQQGHSELIQNSTMWACQLKHSNASSISYSVLWWDFKYIQSVLEVGEECWDVGSFLPIPHFYHFSDSTLPSQTCAWQMKVKSQPQWKICPAFSFVTIQMMSIFYILQQLLNK